MTAVFQFLQQNEPSPQGDHIAFLGETIEEFPRLVDCSTVSPLATKGVLLVSGTDTEKLLQGQLTCDIAQLSKQTSLKGALCDIKGRMTSSFLCIRYSPDSVLLVMDRELISATIETLKKYAVFFKVTLSDASDQFAVFGVHGKNLDAIDTATLILSPITDDLALVICTAEQAEASWQILGNGFLPCGDELWQYLLIQQGEAEIFRQTQGEFIPQMLNFQHTGAVNFRKGCYTGQEVVARMQYLGKLKRRMYHLTVEFSQEFAPGEVVNAASKSNVGTVVMATSGGEKKDLLVVLTAEAVAADILSIGNFQGTFEVTPLPYESKFADAKT